MVYKKVYIVDALRTPLGSFMGSLSSLSASELGVPLVKALIERNKLEPSLISELILGSVLTANQGQAPARQVVIKSGLPVSVSALTVNKVCSSGLMATILGARNIELGVSSVVLAGGAESMSNVPFYVPQMRSGNRLGNTSLIDGIIKDGLWDVYNDYHMGNAGELCAETYKFSREDQDAYAIRSYSRALEAQASGQFKKEILPVKVLSGKVEVEISEDEEPGKFKLDKVSSLKPAFKKDGTITAVNASSINDGASMLLLCSEEVLKKYNLKPRARIISEGLFSQAPEWFTTAPVGAIKNALSGGGLKIQDIDYFEINEAFSSVSMACERDLNIDANKLNIRGGAVSLGHPIGASGARILTSLINVLEDKGGRFGICGICNGGGEASSLLIERL